MIGLFLIFLGSISGFVSVLAGGGVTVILPFLLAIGLSSPIANGTSRVSLAVGAILATYLLYRKGAICWHKIWPLFIVSCIGTIIGAYIATYLSSATMSNIILVTCIASFILICTKPNKWLGSRQVNPSEINIPSWFYFLYFMLCMYGGIIAVDSAILRMAAFVLLINLPIAEANVLKVVTGLPLFLLSAIIYFTHNEVDYTAAGYLAIGTLIGALVAVHYINAPRMRFVAYTLLFIIVSMGTVYLVFLDRHFLIYSS